MFIALNLLIIVMLVLLSGFFAGSETGLISLDKIRMKFLAEEEKVPVARLIMHVTEDPDRFLGTILVATNVCTVSASAFTTNMVLKLYGAEYAWIATFALTLFVLVFGEIIPKAVFRQKANHIVFIIIYPLRVMCVILSPVVKLLTGISNRITGFISRAVPFEKNFFVTKEELKHLLLESELKGVIDKQDRFMINRIFEFAGKRAKIIMVPFKDIESVNMNSSVSDVIELMKKTGFSRIPVYGSSKKKIIGFIAAMDILFADDPKKKASDFIRPILSVSQEIPMDRLLMLMRSRRQQIVLLVDSRRNNAGVVTIEDLLEELVGEIRE